MEPLPIRKNRSSRHAGAPWLWLLLGILLPAAAPAQFLYITNSGSITITGYTGTNVAPVIPANTNGLAVTRLGDGAFQNLTNLLGITTLPNSITNFGNSTFAGSGLATMPYLGAVKSLGTNVFANCLNLTNVPSGFSSFLTNFPDSTFAGCANLTNVSIPGTLVRFGNSVFAGSGLFSLAGFSSVLNIGSNVFANCLRLTNLPNSTAASLGITNLPDGTFSGCVNLTNVYLASAILSAGNSAFAGSGLTGLQNIGNLRSFGANAFANCLNLTNLSSSSVYSIYFTNLPDGMFSGCANLTNIVLNSSILSAGNGAFAGTGLISLAGFGNIRNFGTNAFANCLRLTNAPFSVFSTFITNFADGMFSGCANLTNIYLNNPILSLGNGTFAGSGFYSLQGFGSLRSFGPNQFANCLRLTNLPNNSIFSSYITNLPDGTFAGCVNLTNISLNSSILSLGNSVFAGSGLTTLSGNGFIRSMGTNNFAGCLRLTNLNNGNVFSSYITNLPDTTFAGCANLTNIALNSYLVSLGNSVFAGSGLISLQGFSFIRSLGTNAFANCLRLTNLASYNVFSTLLTNLPDGTFSGCSNLANIYLPYSILTLGNAAFAGCGLANFNCPGNLKTVGTNAFAGCSNLLAVTFPATVTNLEDNAFLNCASLVSLTFSGTPPALGLNVFTGLNPAATLTCPQLAAGWGATFDGLPVNFQIVYPCTTNNGALTITGYLGTDASITIPAAIHGLPVTGIGNAAFADLQNLTGINLPNTITNIGNNAFQGDNLTSVTIPNGVLTIGADAYSLLQWPVAINIPASVTNIGYLAFDSCFRLAALTVDPQNQYYSSTNGILFDYGQGNLITCPENLPGASYVLPATLTNIDDYAFADCNSPSSITLPDGLLSIGQDAFDNFYYLSRINLPASVTSIGENAFYFCLKLTAITVDPQNLVYSDSGGVVLDKSQSTVLFAPGGLASCDLPGTVTTIGNSAFTYCPQLTSLTLPAGVTSIENDAFESDNNLISVNLPAGLTNIGSSAFVGCSQLTGLDLPAGLSYLGDTAFESCSSLTSLTVPAGISYEGQAVFGNCTSVTNVTLQNGTTSVSYGMFYNCARLAAITIPASVTNLGDYIFDGCSSLTNIYFAGNAPGIGGTNEFKGVKATAAAYYLPGATGWGPIYDGLATALLIPQISGASPAVAAGNFGFTINGGAGETVIIEASADLTHWQPIQTNTLTDASYNFSDPQTGNLPGRYYRVRNP